MNWTAILFLIAIGSANSAYLVSLDAKVSLADTAERKLAGELFDKALRIRNGRLSERDAKIDAIAALRESRLANEDSDDQAINRWLRYGSKDQVKNRIEISPAGKQFMSRDVRWASTFLVLISRGEKGLLEVASGTDSEVVQCQAICGLGYSVFQQIQRRKAKDADVSQFRFEPRIEGERFAQFLAELLIKRNLTPKLELCCLFASSQVAYQFPEEPGCIELVKVLREGVFEHADFKSVAWFEDFHSANFASEITHRVIAANIQSVVLDYSLFISVRTHENDEIENVDVVVSETTEVLSTDSNGICCLTILPGKSETIEINHPWYQAKRQTVVNPRKAINGSLDKSVVNVTLSPGWALYIASIFAEMVQRVATVLRSPIGMVSSVLAFIVGLYILYNFGFGVVQNRQLRKAKRRIVSSSVKRVAVLHVKDHPEESDTIRAIFSERGFEAIVVSQSAVQNCISELTKSHAIILVADCIDGVDDLIDSLSEIKDSAGDLLLDSMRLGIVSNVLSKNEYKYKKEGETEVVDLPTYKIEKQINYHDLVELLFDMFSENLGLNHIANGRDPARLLDVVFVHGLGGDYRTTWMSDPLEPTTFWPGWIERPDVGVWSLGYPAGISKIHGHGNALQVLGQWALRNIVSRGLGEKPIVFVTHSMGGILVKQLLRSVDNFQSSSREKSILAKTVGVVFIATPHSGAPLSLSRKLLKYVVPLNPYLEQLQPGNPFLSSLQGWFTQKIVENGISVLSFCELRPTRVWNFGIGKVVGSESGDIGLPGEPPVILQEDHISICKPRSRNSQLYTDFSLYLNEQLAGVQSLLESPESIEDGVDASPK